MHNQQTLFGVCVCAQAKMAKSYNDDGENYTPHKWKLFSLENMWIMDDNVQCFFF